MGACTREGSPSGWLTVWPVGVWVAASMPMHGRGITRSQRTYLTWAPSLKAFTELSRGREWGVILYCLSLQLSQRGHTAVLDSSGTGSEGEVSPSVVHQWDA